MENKFTEQHQTLYPEGLVSRGRGLALDLLSAIYGSNGLDRPRVHFLSLHHVFSGELDNFRAIIEALSRTHHFITYSEGVDRIIDGKIDKPYLAISFDDGLKGALGALKVLNEYGIKAIFFICPPIIGEKNYDNIKEFCYNKMYPAVVEFLDWDDVNMLLSQGHEIGGHTLGHYDLNLLSADAQREEIFGSFEDLKKKIGKVAHFAWPLGKFSNFNRLAAHMVFEAGYLSCASAERGCHVVRHSGARNELCLRRDHFRAYWPLEHVQYFLAHSSRRASVADNLWPKEWRK